SRGPPAPLPDAAQYNPLSQSVPPSQRICTGPPLSRTGAPGLASLFTLKCSGTGRRTVFLSILELAAPNRLSRPGRSWPAPFLPLAPSSRLPDAALGGRSVKHLQAERHIDCRARSQIYEPFRSHVYSTPLGLPCTEPPHCIPRPAQSAAFLISPARLRLGNWNAWEEREMPPTVRAQR